MKSDFKANLIKIYKKFRESQEGADGLDAYNEMTKHPGWKIHEAFLRRLQGEILNRMLSHEFTELDKDMKDILQRSFKNTDDVIEFLINPYQFSQRGIKILQAGNAPTAGKRK